ncbi:metal-dependent hydrolase [Methylophaga thiooxydans]|uniref:Predicted membrane-bound metal-dependent hydrolase family protein n=1 Tax=Methylophaga thiooxydans DMS010 TaxID=637616 RepID=C0N912_9GAMM|nr:metal-dependent hydrolase [Methylophaga thiooxydans]EEF78704.1 Predicted membrane-bound metal-dependent hydrolase family protein [Methylophaga thiooxydans DMS010]
MDTITQALLGGAVGYVVAGKTSRRKAMLWGATIAVLPDLDVLIPYDNDLDSMTFHRSWTHSWFVHTAIAPILALLAQRFDKTFSFSQWFLIIWLVLITHAGLDALTVYGTQLFWPLMPPPVSGGSVFIIDPTYSIPLLAGFLAILVLPEKRISDKVMRYSFMFSCLYLVWGYGIQLWMENQTKNALALQNITYSQLQVSATAFNTLLWRIVVVDDKHYYEGFKSLFENDDTFQFKRYNRGAGLIDKTQNLAAYQRINWFTNGLFKLEKQGNVIVASDLRMGMEPSYFFRFRLAYDNGNGVQVTTPNRIRSENNRRVGVQWVWQRIWNPAVQFNNDSGLL